MAVKTPVTYRTPHGDTYRPLLCHQCGCPLGVKGTRPAVKRDGFDANGYDTAWYEHDGGCPPLHVVDYYRVMWGLPALRQPTLWQRIQHWVAQVNAKFAGMFR